MNEVWRRRGVGAALIILLTFVAYIPAIHGGFVWDDESLITDNRMVHASDGLYRFWFTTESPDYRPLTWSLWWLEWRLWGMDPIGYHVVNVLLHAINSVLMWIILRRLKIPGAWLAGLVFAVHPVNVATVAWISEQKNTLSMLLYAGAILWYLRFDEEGRWRWYGLSLAAFVLALLSKTAIIMVPFVLLGCVWWRHGRVRWKDFLSSVPYFVPSLMMGLVTIFQHQRVLAGAVVRTGGFASRLAAAGWIPWFYLYKALLPVDLTSIYPKWEVDAFRWISYVPGLVLVGGFALFWRERTTWGRPLLFGLGYFVVMLFPVLGFFDQRFYQLSLVADHWQYYAIIAPIALVVTAGERIGRGWGEQGRYWGAVLGVAVLMALGVATWKRSCVYKSNETLWRDSLTKNPDAWMAHYNLGTALLHSGRLEEAIAPLEQAVRLSPGLTKAHSNLGIALAQVGRVQEAVVQLEQAVQIDPDLAEAHANLGHALMLAGRVPEAVRHWEQALRLKPDWAEVHYDLGLASEQMGKTEAAIEHYELALKFNPNMVDAQNRLARLRAVQ